MGSIVLTRRVWLWALAGVALLVALARVLPDTAPESDYALIDLGVLNVLRGAQPVGMYSRFGWHHPGPLYFAILAPFYWLGGLRHFAISAGVISLNVACVLGVFVMLGRQKDRDAITGATGLMGAAFLLGSRDLLASSWTPHIVLLPLALLMIASASLACGHAWALPIVALCASFVVQTHVGSAMCVAVVVLVSIVAAMFHRSPWRAPALVTLALLVVVWAAPVADELSASGAHNLRTIAEFFAHARPAAGPDARYAFEYFFIAPLSPHFGLSWGPTQPPAQSWVSVVATMQTALLLLATVRSFARRKSFTAMLGTLTIAGAVAAYVSITRLPETPKDYTVMWVSILGVMSWVVIVGSIAPWRLPKVRASYAAAFLALLAVTHLTIRTLDDERDWKEAKVLTTSVRAAVRKIDAATVLVHVPQALWGRAAAIVLDLVRNGQPTTVDPEWAPMFGRAYASTGKEPAEISFVDADEHALLGRRTDQRLVGTADSLYVYLGVPPKDAQVATVIPTLEGTHETMGGLPAGLTFIGPGAFAQFAVPNVLPVGVRLLGQPGTQWRLSCAGEAGRFEDVGGVRIVSGGGTQAGDAFFRDLEGCRHVRVYATSQSVTQRLNGFQLLTR